ncbi:hypothetical protein QL996_02585 [Planococcus sp. APC 4015]|nr:hypothetical protein [Planococcus sp. APC 4015]
MSHPAGAVHDDAPPAPAPVPAPQSTPVSSALASAALGLGIAAFVTGWAPFLGALLGAAAVCVALIALSRGQSKPQAVTGLALGVVGFLVSLILSLGTLALVAMGPDAREQFVSGFSPAQVAEADAEDQNAVGGQDEAEPVEEGTRDVGGSVDTEAFTPLDDAGFAAAVADPISVYGDQNVVYGEVQYIDETEWDCSALVFIDDAQQTTWEAYEVSMWAYESADVDCAELKELGELSHVALSITWRGSMTTEWDDGTVEDVLSGEVAHVEVLTPLP